MTTATVYTADALTVLPTLGTVPAIFTSLPDAAETGESIDDWESSFHAYARAVMAAVDPAGYAVFYQTDRRHDGHLASKVDLVFAAAADEGYRIVWHKIAVRTMRVSLFRPGYHHLVAVSRRGTAGRPTPDVYATGPRYYPNGIDLASVDVALDFLVRAGIDHVVDPFAGRGSIARAAAQRGIDTTNVEILPEQVAAFRTLVAPVVDNYIERAA